MPRKITKSYSNNSISINAEVMTSLVSEISVALFAAIDKIGTCLGTARQRKSHLPYKRISETEDFFFCQKNRLRCIRQQVLQLGQSSLSICRTWFLTPVIISITSKRQKRNKSQDKNPQTISYFATLFSRNYYSNCTGPNCLQKLLLLHPPSLLCRHSNYCSVISVVWHPWGLPLLLFKLSPWTYFAD